MAEVTRDRSFDGRRWLIGSLLAAAVGIAVCVLGLVVDHARTLYAWLAVWMWVTTIAIGALLFLLICHACNARWVVVIRRLNHGVTSVFPILALLFIPVVLGASTIYLWVNPPPTLGEHLHHLLEHKRPWLNLPGFIVRTALYLGVFILAAELFRRWSLSRDIHIDDEGEVVDVPEPRDNTRERVAASVLLPFVALALTFGAFDWTMSLEPAWFSTAYGVYVFAGGFVATMALLTLLAFTAVRSSRLDDLITPNHFHALGRLMLAFTVFWAYIAFFQLMLIKIANKPEEVPFYITRSAGSWRAVSWTLIIGHFALPFLYLIPRAPKFRRGAMALVAGWILMMHLIDCFWLVLPVLLPHGFTPHWIDVGAIVAVVGSVLAFGLWRQRGVPLIAETDPWLEDSRTYRSPT